MSEDGKVRFDNPIAADDLDDDKSPGTPGRMADFEHELTDDELGDLTYAFQAMDADANGTLEPDELHAMMAVLGAGVDMATVETMFRVTSIATPSIAADGRHAMTPARSRLTANGQIMQVQ